MKWTQTNETRDSLSTSIDFVSTHFFQLFMIAASIALAYSPVIDAGFVWDDHRWLVDNPLLDDEDGLERIWFSTDQPSQYFPLVYTTYWIEKPLFGLDPMGYHVVNVVLHAIGTVLVWRALVGLGIAGSFLAALLFSLHPVHVESVAWITERKNVLVLVFSAASFLAWRKFASSKGKSAAHYTLALILYALALASKTTACTLPAAFIVAGFLKREPLNSKRVWALAPFVVLGLAAGLLSIWWEQNLQGLEHEPATLVTRFLVACRALFFYLGKLVWPMHLSFSYPQWGIAASSWEAWVAPVALLGLTIALGLTTGRIGRGPLAAWLYFIATLSPMLGFVSLYTFQYTWVADHYQYVASIGPLALIASSATLLSHRVSPRAPKVMAIVAGLILVLWGHLTHSQCLHYRDSQTLWRATLHENPNSWLAHQNLAIELQQVGRLEEAREHFELALQERPGDARSLSSLGTVYYARGDIDRAVTLYLAASESDPHLAEPYYNLAIARMAQGRHEEAIALNLEALRNRPRYPQALNNLGALLMVDGDFLGAKDCFTRALAIDPNLTQAREGLARIKRSSMAR